METTGGAQSRLRDPGVAGPVLVRGFGVALAVWCSAFLTHVPWLDLPGRVAGPIVLGAWLAASVIAGRGRQHALVVGGLSGVLTALLSLLILGSALVEQPATTAQAAPGLGGLRPSALVFVPGFLVLGGAIGAAGGMIGARVPTPRHAEHAPQSPLFGFAVITALGVAALLVLGGAVTSTRSGMAIRGWPDSDAVNIFLYPLSLMADPQRFLEHSHRLMGTFVGLCSIVLCAWTFLADRRGSVRAAATILLAGVIAQGVLGGLRVIQNDAVKGLVHGILGQAILALAAGLAAALSPAHVAGPPPAPHRAAGRLRALTTAFIAVMLVQLSLGAAYRHLADVSRGATHALYTHVAFSLVVVALAVVTGGGIAAAGREADPILRRTGKALFHTVGLQFVLGGLALWAVMVSPARGTPAPGGGPITTPAPEALVTMAHQAVGAGLFTLAALAWVWARRRLRRP